jgi:hypothetical protein
MGDLTGLEEAFRRLVQDAQSTWMVDVALPAEVRTGRVRRLTLSQAGPPEMELRYPEYWAPESVQERYQAQLRSQIPAARLEAARQLFHQVDRSVLRSLAQAAQRESDEEVRELELAAMVNIAAHLLIHGGQEDQELALGIIPRLLAAGNAPATRLAPALAVYGKAPRPKGMARRGERYRQQLAASSL